jgi:hypothetical protein
LLLGLSVQQAQELQDQHLRSYNAAAAAAAGAYRQFAPSKALTERRIF